VYDLYDFENQHRGISLNSINKMVVAMDIICIFGNVKPDVLNRSEMHYILHWSSSTCPDTRVTVSCQA
jgi:hypothetical protein